MPKAQRRSADPIFHSLPARSYVGQQKRRYPIRRLNDEDTLSQFPSRSSSVVGVLIARETAVRRPPEQTDSQ